MRVKEGTQFLFPKKDVRMGFGCSFFCSGRGKSAR